MKVSPEGKLSAARFRQLVDVLNSINVPLGDLCTRLWDPANHFDSSAVSVGTTLAALLQDNLLPSPPHRLVAIYILYDMLVTPHPAALTPAPSTAIDRLVASPLTVILFNLLDCDDARPPEQLFLTHLLSHTQSAGAEAVPPQIANAQAFSLYGALQSALQSGASVPKLNMSMLRRSWAEKHPNPPNIPRIAPISAVLPDPSNAVSAENLTLADELGEVVTLEDFTPEFVRIPPPFLPVTTECKELRWIDPEPLHELIWDPDMGMKGERGSEVREVIARALKSPVQEAEQKMVVAELDKDPKLVHLCGMTPQKLPDLVQNNSQLAIDILLKLVSSNQMPQYLSALENMEVNMHSMEVVSRLTDSVELPPEILHTYISKCIRSCAIIPDRYDQIRMVRFVCVFLKRIMKNNLIDAQDLLIEVQAFCIDNSRIREVADLFRSLKMHGNKQ